MKFNKLRDDQASAKTHLIGLIGVVVVIGIYNILFSFSYLPITEGWFSAYSELILQGKVPYRDFYLYLTPFYPVVLSLVIGVFGDSFFVLRVIGMFVIVGTAVLLYLILARSFKPASSMMAAITATIYYQSGVAHITYDFTQVLTILTVGATWMFTKVADDIYVVQKTTWNSSVVRGVFFAGIFACLAFFTKQSNGLFVLIAAWISCVYCALLWGKEGIRIIVAFVVGCAIPSAIIISWLTYTAALPYFWEQIFGGALEAKGSLFHVFFSWIDGIFTSVFLLQMLTVCKLLLAILLLSFIAKMVFFRLDKPINSVVSNILFVVSLLLLNALIILGSYTQILGFGASFNIFVQQLINHIVPVAISICLGILFLTIASCFVPKIRSKISPKIIVLGIISTGMIWGNGTSAGLSEVGVFLITALVLAMIMDSRWTRYVGFTAIVIVMLSLTFSFASRKFDAPYTWWGVAEPSVLEAHKRLDMPIVSGLKVSVETAENMIALTDSLKRGDAAGDVFAFPNIPLIYLLTNRWPTSKVVVPWFDFLPDGPSRQEARRILQNPPAMIVNLNLPSSAWTAHERLFRDNKPLGQRDILNAIQLLTVQHHMYKLDFEREVSPGCLLQVWHKVTR